MLVYQRVTMNIMGIQKNNEFKQFKTAKTRIQARKTVWKARHM